MTAPAHRVRRATVDDLSILQSLWASMHLPVSELERRPTDFQVVEGEDGAILGAVGIEILERTGRIHSEAYHDFGLSEILRQSLWDRLQSVATNHGLARLWTQETAPFWTKNGFREPNPEELKRLPAAWATESKGWLTLKLRDEEALEKALDKEFARFKAEERRRTESLLRKGKILKIIGTILAVLLLLGVLTFGVMYAMRSFPQIFRR